MNAIFEIIVALYCLITLPFRIMSAVFRLIRKVTR